MFPVTLYTFSKEVNSTRRPTGQGSTYSCQSNADFDIINPRIPLAMAAGSAANPTAYNYMYVAAWGRYYWINRWAWEGGLWTAYGSVDALASWKTEIGATSAYILRAASEKDPLVIDTLYPTKANPTIEMSSVNNPWAQFMPGGCIVCGIIGSGATQYYYFTPINFTAFINYLLSDQYTEDVLSSFAYGQSQTLLDGYPELKMLVEPLQYIASIIWLPFRPDPEEYNLESTITIKVGFVSVTAASASIGYGLSNKTLIWTDIPKHPDAASRGAYCNTSLSGYEITIPPFGTIQLDPGIVGQSTSLAALITIDARTGAATMELRSNGGGALLARLDGNLGVQYQVGQVVNQGYGLATGIQTGIQVGGSVISGASSGGIVGGLVNAISGGLGMVGDAAKCAIPHASSTGSVGSISQFHGDCNLQATFYRPVAADNTHRGSPLCAVRTISNLSGYILCCDVELSIPCTAEETTQIKAYMEGGFFYA